ncbi:MAG TPA: TonB family protein [Mucilaginibacter sp.]|nr:TonB family protein [Mucilaginibacter sp.]
MTREIIPDPADRKLFIVEDTYYNGKIRLNGKSLTPDPYYKGQGDFKWYYLNGGLRETATYENGKISGERVGYYLNGNKQFIYVYDNATLLSSSQFFPNGKPYYTAVFDTAKKLDIVGDAYDLAGNATAVNGNGSWVNYADTFKRIFSKGPIVNGIKDGEWKGKLTDTLTTFVCIYNKGILVSGTTYEESGKVIHFTKEEIEPSPKGGLELFYKQLAAHVKYPKKAKEDNIQGKGFLSFTIGKDGELDNIKVAPGIGGGCDEATVEALKKTSQPWTPGSQYGLPVRVQYNLPLTFSLKE